MYKKITIGKGKKKRNVPKTYVPESLSPADRKKQEKSILEGKKRPKLESFESKPSPFIKKFEKLYGKKITDKKWIHENLLRYAGQDQIIKKGQAAYFTAGSRPNQTLFSWSRARLASSLVFGKAARIDKDILLKYGKGKFLEEVKKKYFKEKK